MIENSPPPVKSSLDALSINSFTSRTELTEKSSDKENTEHEHDNYNPFENRPTANSHSTMGSLVTLMNGALGIGILAMPLAFKNAGLVFGVFGTVAVGFICAHSITILVRTSRDICRIAKKPSLGFAETVAAAFTYGPPALRKYSNGAKHFIDYALMATYFSSLCIFVVLTGDSFRNVIENRFKLGWDKRIYMAFVMIPALMIGQIRQLKYLIPFSVIANICASTALGITLYYIFDKPLEFADKPYIASFEQIPSFFSTVIFAMAGIGMIMPVENSMRKPQHFLGCPGVLNVNMILVASMHLTVGFFGYARYGERVEDSITSNLAPGEPAADTAKIVMALRILFSFGLQFYVPMDILWRKIKGKFNKDKHNRIQFIVRSFIILCIGALAVAIPMMQPLVGLVGAIFYCLLGLLVPPTVETVYRYPGSLGPCKWILWKNMILVIFGIFALVTGTINSFKKIIDYINSNC